MKPGELVLTKRFRDKRQKMIRSEFRAATMIGFVPSQLILEEALTGESDRIRTMYLQGTNPLVSHPDAGRTYKAITHLDFLAVSEVFLTPTAQMADLVLPAATNFEFDDIGHYGFGHGYVLARPKIVDPPAECWPDSKILNELGRRLGVAKFFWENVSACLDEIVKPAGITYDDFVKCGMLKGNWESTAFRSGRLDTPSGKVEIYCRRLENWEYDPLPTYREKIDGRDPFALCEAFPLILTSAKDPFSFHSANRNLPSLRRLSPDPVVCVHPDTAHLLGLTDGQWALIETEQGAIRQRVRHESDLDRRVVVASAGWWFPERNDLELSGWKASNLNILTRVGAPCDSAIGTPLLRAIPCRIRPIPKTDQGKSETKPGSEMGDKMGLFS
ncbi:MAG: molybdopterin-dependent oxidoreductase [Desulfobacterales bacterium]|nr:MAG: molybdopterin-dependent oxidoreductase [Desulfobacterales bacterium]